MPQAAPDCERTIGPSPVGEQPCHGFLMGHLTRTPGRNPLLVFGDGGIGFGLVQLGGRRAVFQRLQHAVLIQRDDDGGLTAEMYYVVTVMLVCLRAHGMMLAFRSPRACWPVGASAKPTARDRALSLSGKPRSV